MTPIKDPEESIVLKFDFSSELTSISSASVAVSVYEGTDAAPSAMLDGAVQINGASVFQRIQGGLAGVSYTMRCVATNGSDIIVRSDMMPVRTA